MRFIISVILLIWLHQNFYAQNDAIKVGSKTFTESVILGEIITQLAASKDMRIEHRRELGGTTVLWNALLKGDIDIYPDYTGTLRQEILSSQDIKNDKELKQALNKLNIGMSEPLGFNNTYALGMHEETAARLNIKTISDLKNYPELHFGFSNEFIDRGDGWRSLQKFYNLPQSDVKGLDHDLAYRGLQNNSIDVIDIYSTDAEIKYYNLRVIKDDRIFFTEYKAVILYRKDLENKAPEVLKEILQLENSIPDSIMIAMNAEVKISGSSEGNTAAAFIKNKFQIKTGYTESGFFDRLITNTQDHLFLVLISLSAAIFVSIPLGIAAYKFKKLNKLILGTAGIIQTIPSLALLVFMIPLLGIGSAPAIVALFLYSLLPVIRNTYTGLDGIPGHLKESAEVLGISQFAKLWLIELPLASPSILAGIKTSAVINVGTATLGALIGAGGFGQPILTGIRLDNISLILEGAVPAAVLAILVQLLFDFLEKYLVPGGLRIRKQE